jgi:hypothetical protein
MHNKAELVNTERIALSTELVGDKRILLYVRRPHKTDHSWSLRDYVTGSQLFGKCDIEHRSINDVEKLLVFLSHEKIRKPVDTPEGIDAWREHIEKIASIESAPIPQTRPKLSDGNNWENLHRRRQKKA